MKKGKLIKKIGCYLLIGAMTVSGVGVNVPTMNTVRVLADNVKYQCRVFLDFNGGTYQDGLNKVPGIRTKVGEDTGMCFIASIKPEREGYKFIGWEITNGSDRAYIGSGSGYLYYTGPTENSSLNNYGEDSITVTANWEKIIEETVTPYPSNTPKVTENPDQEVSYFTIILDPNGGKLSGSDNAQTFFTKKGKPFYFSSYIPEREGYEFLEWNSKPDGTGNESIFGGASSFIYSDKIFYAQWRNLSETQKPTLSPIEIPTQKPTLSPIEIPTQKPTLSPTLNPTILPTLESTIIPTQKPTEKPTEVPTEAPTEVPTEVPIYVPTEIPIYVPTIMPTKIPTLAPTEIPTKIPTLVPTIIPTQKPTEKPTEIPAEKPTEIPTETPTAVPTEIPTQSPTEAPTQVPTEIPTLVPPVTSSPTPLPVKLKVKSITIGKGEKVTFPLVNKKGNKIVYHTDNKKVASIGENGSIIGKQVGNTKVYAFSNGKKYKMSVKVKKKPVTVKISRVSNLKMSKGDKLILQAVLNKGAASYHLAWKTSNKKVIEVNSNGVAIIKGKGRAVVTVKTYNGVKGKAVVTVKTYNGVKGKLKIRIK